MPLAERALFTGTGALGSQFQPHAGHRTLLRLHQLSKNGGRRSPSVKATRRVGFCDRRPLNRCFTPKALRVLPEAAGRLKSSMEASMLLALGEAAASSDLSPDDGRKMTCKQCLTYSLLFDLPMAPSLGRLCAGMPKPMFNEVIVLKAANENKLPEMSPENDIIPTGESD